MSVVFEVYSADGQAVGSGDGTSVDWDGLNNYIVNACGLQDGDTLIGYVSALYDLGIQTPADQEYEFEGKAEEEAVITAANPLVYFKDGKDDKGNPIRLKCSPSKPFQHVTFAVDFPDIMLDKGKFFGEDGGAKPLRLYLGGQFFISREVGMVVQNPLSMKNTTSTGAWSFNPKATIYKMAVGAKLIKQGEPFQSKQVGDLLGKSLQWLVQIGFHEAKNGKKYLEQNIKFAAGLGRGQAPIDPVTEIVYVGFNKDNSPEAIAEMPKHIVNTIKLASNFKGSKIEAQLLAKDGEPAVVSQEKVVDPIDLETDMAF